MATWTEFSAAAPELAERVKATFDAHKHKTMATLRKDGSPRISGTEVEFSGRRAVARLDAERAEGQGPPARPARSRCTTGTPTPPPRAWRTRSSRASRMRSRTRSTTVPARHPRGVGRAGQRGADAPDHRRLDRRRRPQADQAQVSERLQAGGRRARRATRPTGPRDRLRARRRRHLRDREGRAPDRDRPQREDDRGGPQAQPGRRVHPRRRLEDADLGDRRFDTIFACRVGLFHREPDRARELAERWLAPGGTLHVAYDSPISRRASAER